MARRNNSDFDDLDDDEFDSLEASAARQELQAAASDPLKKDVKIFKGSRLFGLVLCFIGLILAIGLFVVESFFGQYGLENFIYEMGYTLVFDLNLVLIIIAGVVLLQIIYYVAMFASNSKLSKHYRSATLAIILFPLFGFIYIFYIALERNDKRKTSRANFVPVLEEYIKIDKLMQALGLMVKKRESQASYWSGNITDMESLSPQVRKSVEELENATDRFLAMHRHYTCAIFFDEAKKSRIMIDKLNKARDKAFRAKDLEAFFMNHIDKVKIYEKHIKVN